MKIEIKDNIINKISDAIRGTKFENHVYVAGGYVRDLMMGNENHDYDFCVDLPGGGIELAEYLTRMLGGTNVVVYERYGTAQVTVDGFQLEFVMTRKESYGDDGRNPNVEPGTIHDDISRRDFTINAMVINISTGELIDEHDGVADIEAKVIRTTGDPHTIFEDDPLRILRCIRFASRFNFRIDDVTLIAARHMSSSVITLSNERVRDEIIKLLSHDNPVTAINMMLLIDLPGCIRLPELTKSVGLLQNDFHTKDVYGHILDVVRHSKPTTFHRLAALLHDIGKCHTVSYDDNGVHFIGHEFISDNIAMTFMSAFKFSNEQIELVSSAVRNHMRISADISDNKIRKIRSELGDEHFFFLLDLCEADRKSHVDCDMSVINHARELSVKEPRITGSNLCINGDDVMKLTGLKPGREVGRLLGLVKDASFLNPGLTVEEAEHIVMLNVTRVPRACFKVKCMIKGCQNLASHKVGEENI